MNDYPAVKLDDLEDALMFVDAGNGFDTHAWVCRETGAVLWHSNETDEFGPLPAGIDNADRYVPVPGKRELELGKSLPLEFARTHLPACFEQVYAMFSRHGAYARFKDLLERHDSLDAWHQWEEEQTRQALRAWCAENSIPLAE